MGRPKIQFDETEILTLRSQGMTIKDISRELGISTATLSRRIGELRNKQGLLTKYRELQGLHLTELQCRVMEAISPDKIAESSLLDLVKCLYVIHKMEMRLRRKEEEKSGLVTYLLEIERLSENKI